VFPEQVSPATNPDKNMNLTEGLRPWQPQKIYYFYNPTHDIFEGQGPQYSSRDISPSRNVSYGMLAAQAFSFHMTQEAGEVVKAIADKNLESSSAEVPKIIMGPTKLIFGKSLVPSGATDDVFAGVVPDGIPYQRPPGYIAVKYSEPTLTIGDPWAYYQKLWRAHGLDHLASIVQTEVSVHTDGTLAIPLVFHNPSDAAVDVSFSVKAPDGWMVIPVAPASVTPHSQYYLRVQAAAPSTKLPGWQQFTVTAESENKNYGTVSIRVELSNGWVAPQ
jgi:hypothetical protein